ncbi:hypothetical protein ACFYKX_03730 [Cytobacillus sp. FJAT-54145]|uniref:Uncharacterized protein n=1 Tax=Cytobacillus spartinae TaxID=3299023 RepID=A0ABW6K6B9_9BACI
MKGFLLWLCILGLFFMTACTQTKDTISENERELNEKVQKLTQSLNEKGNEIKQLAQSKEELNQKIDSFILEKENFPVISNISREFVQAHTAGDKEKLRELLSEDVNLLEKDSKLYVRISGNDYEWLLFDPHIDSTYDDWVIQGYQYDPATDTYSVFIREFFSDINGESVSPPTFLGLTFKYQENQWKIISLGFDV